MLRKKILLLGLRQDKNNFLNRLEQVENTRNVYVINSQQVEISTTIEQFKPDHICSQSLDGFNAKDESVIDIQDRIPDDMASYVYFMDTEEKMPAKYVSEILKDIKDKSAYHHQEPSVASFFSSLFCVPRKRETACPENHTSDQPFECSAVSWVISSK